MPVQPDSRYASLPVFKALAPDGTTRQVMGLRWLRSQPEDTIAQYRVTQGETIDLLAKQLYGDEQLWWRILDANPVIYPLDIPPGSTLNLPSLSSTTRITRARRF